MYIVLWGDLDNFGSCWRSARCFMTIERSFYTLSGGRSRYAHLCDKKQPLSSCWGFLFTLCALCPPPGGGKRNKYVRTKGRGVVMLMTKCLLATCMRPCVGIWRKLRLPQREVEPFGTFNSTIKGMPLTRREGRRIKFHFFCIKCLKRRELRNCSFWFSAWPFEIFV